MTIKRQERPWWADSPMEKQSYREHRPKVTKADKIKTAMGIINAIRESLRPQIKADRGIAIVRGAIK